MPPNMPLRLNQLVSHGTIGPEEEHTPKLAQSNVHDTKKFHIDRLSTCRCKIPQAQ